MKLDSIIYDTNTLSAALTDQLVDESPTFNAMYPSETSTSLVNLLAGYGSMLQYTIVSAIANCYTDTAFSPSAIYQLAETLGNRLHGNVSSQLYCNIRRTSLTGRNGIVIPRNSTFQIEGIPFFNPDPITFTRDFDDVNGVLLIQGENVTVEYTTSGIAGEKFYFSTDFKCNMNMVKVYVNGQEWNTTDSFLSLNSTQFTDEEQSNTVILRMSSDGRAYIKIGNDTNGTLPPSGSVIRIEYVSNEGANGNIEKTNMVADLTSQIYYVDSGENKLLTVDITTPQPAYGGFNTQSLDVLRESSPYIFASGNRAVRRDDYKALLLNKCGYISTNVWGEYEEAKMQGGYDKIMMNTVYYTGIKEIQNYDYRPMGALSIPDSVEGITPKTPMYFSSIVGTIRGFPGSYEIDLIYSVDDEIQIKYADKNGNGVLVCDPSDNDEWYDTGDGSQLYPYDDAKELYGKGDGSKLNVQCLQGTVKGHREDKLFEDADNTDFIFSGTLKGTTDPAVATISQTSGDSLTDLQVLVETFAQKVTEESAEYVFTYDGTNWLLRGEIVILSEYGISYSGTPVNDDELTVDYVAERENAGAETKISFNSPLQIELTFSKDIAISMFAFKTPGDKANIGNFPGTISIYGTNENYVDKEFMSNIKNNSLWERVAEVQKINIPDEPGKWSDWITTNLYNQAGDTWKKFRRYVIEVYDFHKGGNAEWGEPCYIGQLKFMLDEMNVEYYAWGGNTIGDDSVTPLYFTKSLNPAEGDEVYDEKTDIVSDHVVSRVMTDVEIHYLMMKNPETGEEYTSECSASKTPLNSNKNITLSHKTSTINYENNSVVDMCIPELWNEENNVGGKKKMDYYKYNIDITGLTSANGYRTNDRLIYSFNNGMYANVLVTNINTNSYEVSINNSIGVVTNPDSVQTGNRKLDVSGVALSYLPGTEGEGAGAKLTISSDYAINIYGTFIGNAYSTATAQSTDSPIIEQYNHFTTYTEFKQPRVKNVKIDVTVEYKDSLSYKDTKKKVEDAIYEIFNITPYYVGKSLNVADIWEAINNVAGVKRFIVTYPTTDIECKPYEFISLPKNNLKITDKFNEEFK